MQKLMCPNISLSPPPGFYFLSAMPQKHTDVFLEISNSLARNSYLSHSKKRFKAV
jgi:hypothetical protein